jgi:regulator of sigma E protease
LTGAAPFTVRLQRDTQELDVRVQPTPADNPAPPRIGVQLLPRVVRSLRADVPIVQKLGIARGDLVLAIDDVPFTAGSLDVAHAGGPSLRVLVRRAGQELRLEQPATRDDRIAFAENVALTTDDSLLLSVLPDFAAAAAGMRAGDRIDAVNGHPIRTFDDLRRVVEDSDGKPLALVVARAGATVRLDLASQDLVLTERLEFTLTPAQQPLFETGLQPSIPHRTEMVRAESFGQALGLGCALSLDMIKQLYVTMKRMVTGDVGAKNLGGIIRISQVSYQAAQRGTSWFLYLLAMLSLNLAFVNLLPIPVLDGGHLLFLLIEKVKGSPVSSRVFGYSQVVGLTFVLMLVLFVTYNDILQLL